MAGRFSLILAHLAFVFCMTAWGQIGSIDTPQFEDVVAGNMTVEGWAMDSTAVLTNVEIFVDGADFGSVSYGRKRLDACNAIGQYPGCPNVGWTIQFNTAALPDGPHMLKLVSTTSDNRQSSMLRAFIVDNSHQGLTATTVYKIVNRATGKVLDVTDLNPLKGAYIQEHQYLGGANQLWTIYATDDGNFTFESLSSSKVLTPLDHPAHRGTRIIQEEDFGELVQEWAMIAAGDGSYALLNGSNGLALDLQSGSSANGTPILIRDYSGGTNQNWRFVPVINPPGGIWGAGSDVGSNSPPPQLPDGDILNTKRTPGQVPSLAKCLSGLSPSDIKAQISGTLADSVTGKYARYKNLLSQPGGLACAARQTNHLVVDSYSAVLKSMNLLDLTRASDAIALCKVLGQSSSINRTTNIVTTRVHLQVDERFKGAIGREAYVDIRGGHVVFAPDARADVRTIESTGIGNGLEILIFLSRTTDPGAFRPTNGMEGIFWVSLANGIVTPITRYDGHSHLFQSASLTLAEFRARCSAADSAALHSH